MPESKRVRLRVLNTDTNQVCGFLPRKPTSGSWSVVSQEAAGTWSRTGGAVKAVKKQYRDYLAKRYSDPPKITFETVPLE